MLQQLVDGADAGGDQLKALDRMAAELVSLQQSLGPGLAKLHKHSYYLYYSKKKKNTNVENKVYNREYIQQNGLSLPLNNSISKHFAEMK